MGPGGASGYMGLGLGLEPVSLSLSSASAYVLFLHQGCDNKERNVSQKLILGTRNLTLELSLMVSVLSPSPAICSHKNRQTFSQQPIRWGRSFRYPL